MRGYFSKNNRSAKIGPPITEGHDFAWIAGRWLVDYWAFRVRKISRTSVLDLDLRSESELAINLYGDPQTWSLVAEGDD